MKHTLGRGPSVDHRETRLSASPQRFEIRKNADGSRSIRGTAVVFNSLSQDLGGFVERVSPGAFTQSLIDRPDVLILAQHDMDQLLGRVSSGTAKVWQDDRGLQFSCQLPDTTWARDLIALMERGDVSQMSFGFSIPEGGETWTEVRGVTIRTITVADLYECSVVTVPAYASTSVSLRAAPAHIKAQLKAKRKKAKRAADEPTKTVDGEVLHAEDFIIVGDTSDPETWHLPWKFSTEEKIKSHLRDALTRFDQLKGLSEDVLAAAWKKLVELCKEHDIEVSADDDEGERGYFTSISLDDDDEDCDPDVDPDCEDFDEDDDEEERCDCRCAACLDDRCAYCSNETCEDDGCTDCPIQQRSAQFEMILRRLR